MERDVRFFFNNIIFDINMEVSNDPDVFREAVQTLVSRYLITDDGSQPVVMRDSEQMVKVQWRSVVLDVDKVNGDHRTAVLSTRAPDPPPAVQPPAPPAPMAPIEPEPVAMQPLEPEPAPVREQSLLPEPEPATGGPEPEEQPAPSSPSPEPHEVETLDLSSQEPLAPQVQSASVCFLDERGRPLAGRGYLWHPDGGREETGLTDNRGRAEFSINRTGVLTLLRSSENGDVCTWMVRAGDLSTVATPHGIRNRLIHLGFRDPHETSETSDRDALNRFRKRFGLPPGPLDQETRNLLARVHRDSSGRGL